MLLRSALLFAGLALAAGSTTGPQLVFPRSSELVYSWRADVSTGATSPDNLDNHISHFSLSANVRVLSDAAAKRVLFKIEGLKFSAYNGRATRGKLPAGAYQMLEFVQTNCSCRLPFAASFDAGKVSHAEFQANDALFSRNVKKSILSQFQLDLAHISSSPAFQIEERGITGLCPVEHLVTRRATGHVALRKFWDARRCEEEPTVRLDNMSPRPCGPRQMSPVSSTSERLYELRHEGEDVLLVDTVRSRSGISLQPRGLLTENHFHVTNQTLQLVSVVESVEEEAWDLQGDVVKTSLVFAFPRADLESGAEPDTSFGKNKHNHTAIVDMAETLLERMASRLDSEAEEALRPEQLHTLDVQHLLGVLRVLDVASLRRLSERILLGTSYQAETVRSLALELLPRVGTLAAARLVTELITQEKVTPSEADDMLDELPFHLRHPSERLLHDCKPLLDLGTSDAILAFSSLVGKVCSTPGVCSPALIDEYAKLFFGKLRDSEEYASQLLYLQAMNNVRVGPVAEYLEPLIQGRLNYSHQLRFLAVWAAMESHATNPDKAYSVYWPMLANTQEHPEMRHAALTMLLLARPTPDRFMNLLCFLSGERDAQLYNMFYTSVQSLLDTNHPCFLHMTGPARQVARLIPKPPTSRLRSHNHIFDFNDPESGSGVKFQEVVIADEATGAVSVMYVDAVPHYLGLATSQLAIHLRIEGDVVGSLVGGKTEGSEHGALHILLESLNVTPRSSQPAHVELLVRVQGRTIECYYFNQTNIDQIRAVLGSVMSLSTALSEPRGFHVNKQYLDVAASLESVQASDLGLPVTISLQRPELLSIRGNFSTERQGSALIFNTHFNFRLLRMQSYGMYTMSPVTGNWHGVTRANSLNAHWPLRSSFALDMSQFSAKLRFDWPQNQRAAYGGARHVRTHTWLYGIGAKDVLRNSCASCSNSQDVHSSSPARNVSLVKRQLMDSELELNVVLTECEQAHELRDRSNIWRALSSQNKNFRSAPWARPWLSLMQLQEMVERSPGSGSCGVSLRVVPTGRASSVELTVKAESDRNSSHLVRSLVTYRDATGKAFKSWDANLVVEHPDVKQFALKLKLTRQQEVDSDFAINYLACMKLDGQYPDLMPSHVPWDLLYDTTWSRHETRLQLALSAGPSTDGSCPSGSQLQATLVSVPRDRHPTVDPLRECEAERGSHVVYPASEACKTAANGVLLSRNTSITFTASNWSTEVQRATSRLVSALHLMYPEDIPERLGSSFTLQLETSAAGDVALWATGAEQPGTLHVMPAVSSFVAAISARPHIGTAAAAIGMAHTCTAAGGYVLTFDQASLSLPVGSGWTLLSAHCTNAPTFGVFVRRSDGMEALAARVHMLDDVIEITPDENSQLAVLVNGEAYKQEKSSVLKVRELEGVVRVYHKNLHVAVRLAHGAVTVVVPGAMAGYVCGLCGDLNTDPETFYNFRGPDGSTAPLDQLVALYTLQ